MTTTDRLTIRRVPVADMYHLRGEIMRPGQPRENLMYPGDDDPITLHLGAYLDGEQVGIVSIYHEPTTRLEFLPPDTDSAELWRIRSIAVVPQTRRLHVGSRLLDVCRGYAFQHGGNILWANARLDAIDFYRAAGFRHSEVTYNVPGHGERYFIWRALVPDDALCPAIKQRTQKSPLLALLTFNRSFCFSDV